MRAPPVPHLIAKLMAYMATIVRVSKDFAGLAWVRYDAAFCRQAALTRNERWSTINSALYTMRFAGMASSMKHCELCFATTHTEQECAQRGDPDPGIKDRLKAIETAVLAITGKRDAVGKQQLPVVLPSYVKHAINGIVWGAPTPGAGIHTHAVTAEAATQQLPYLFE